MKPASPTATSPSGRKSQRLRRKPNFTNYDHYNYSTTSAKEERLLQQVIMNSKAETRRPLAQLDIPSGPTFFPTVEEFEGNPILYVQKIRPIAEKYGICKIVPPAGWNPPMCVNLNSKEKIQTKDQLLHRIQEGISFGDGEEYYLKDYIRMAQSQTKTWLDTHEADSDHSKVCPEKLEQHYWDTVEMQREYNVEYGNDIDTNVFGSGFPRSERGRDVGGKEKDREKKDLPEPKFGTDDFYKESYWNLSNIPNCPGSILQHIKVSINGINVPWLYFGNLFSTFCWHNEDNYLYSINYHHWGAPKLWYGVPGSKECAEGLEKLFKSYLSMKMRDEPDLLHHITTMFSPRLLQTAKVPVCKLVQHPGEFVVTFPRAFHGGFSMGPNIGEAVNFATHDWIPHGSDSSERYRSFARPAVFSQNRLAFTAANNLDEHKSLHDCRLLIKELERLLKEEIKMRRSLLDDGVRDVSHCIKLPKNRLDQLDEESADYDDKRLCHACKHICFFSCVACECSESTVSCLRHSHYMCRCPTERRYMMIWTPEDEMRSTLQKVRKYAHELEQKEPNKPDQGCSKESIEIHRVKKVAELPPVAAGSLEDKKLHEDFKIDLSPKSPIFSLPGRGLPILDKFNQKLNEKRESQTQINSGLDNKRLKIDIINK